MKKNPARKPTAYGRGSLRFARRIVVHLAVDYFSNAARVCAMTSL